MLADIRADGGAGLVVVDTVSACLGWADADSREGIAGFVAGCDGLRAGGASLVAVHHDGSDPGSTFLRREADTVIRLDFAKGKSAVSVDVQPRRGDPVRYTLARRVVRFQHAGQMASSLALEPVRRRYRSIDES